MRPSNLLRLVFLCLSPAYAMAVTPPPAAEIVTALAPLSTTHLQVAPGSQQPFSVAVRAGETILVAVQQTTGTVSVTLAVDAAQTQYKNRSGRLSWISIHIAGSAKGDARLMVANLSKTKTAEVELHVGAVHATTEQDRDEASAESLAAVAEGLLKQHESAGMRRAVTDLEEAERLMRKAGNQQALVRDMTLRAFALGFPMNDAAGALPLATEVCTLATALPPEAAVEAGNAWKTCGFVNANLAKYDAADDYYGRALARFEMTSDLYNQVVVRENRAKIERIQQKNDAALADLNAALPMATSSGDLRGELGLRVEQGALLYEMNELGPAYEADMEALSVSRKNPDNYLEALTWNDLGVIYTDLRDFEHASDAFAQADQLFDKEKNDYGKLQVLHGKGELHFAQGNWKAAAEAFERGAALSEEKSLPREYVYYAWGLALTEMRTGRMTEAQTLLGKALDVARKNKIAEIEASLLNAQAEIALHRRDWSMARQIWEQALQVAAKNQDAAAHLQALGGLARLARARADNPQAADYSLKAIDEIESTRSGIAVSQLRMNYLASKRAFYELAVDTLMDSGQPLEAFRVCEQGRARMLLDQMHGAGVQPVDDPASTQLQVIRIALATAEEHASLLKIAHANARAVAAEQTKIRQLVVDEHRERELAAGGGRSDALQAAVPSGVQVREALPDAQTELLEYWLGTDRSYLWCFTRNAFHVYKLPGRTEVERAVDAYLSNTLEPLRGGSGESATERALHMATARSRSEEQARHLYRMLLPHGVIAPVVHRLVLVPDGPLHSLPFAALPAAMGGYMGRRYAIVVEPSAAAILTLLETPATSQTLRTAVFSEPVLHRPYANSEGAALRSDERGSLDAPSLLPASFSSSLPPLPYAKVEIESIRRIFGADKTDLYTGFAASRETALRMDWQHYTIAHFATHTLLNSRDPQFSGLLLSAFAQRGPVEDPVLSYADILHMKAPLQLVVLSACSSAGGTKADGEGLAGIGNAFFGAGTRRVVGSLWQVDDEATSEWMRSFYRSLQRTHSAARALQQAQASLAADPRWSAPAYWAAFTLSGDWRGFD